MIWLPKASPSAFMSAKTSVNDESPEKRRDQTQGVALTTRRVGIWSIMSGKSPKHSLHFCGFRRALSALSTFVDPIRHVLCDIYALGPGLMYLYFLSKAWSGLQSTILLRFSSQMLQAIEAGIKTGRPDTIAIGSAILSRVLCVICDTLLGYAGDQVFKRLEARVTDHYEQYLLEARLRMDLATPGANKINVYPADAFRAFDQVAVFFANSVSTLGQMGFILRSYSFSVDGLTFALLCVAQPVYQFFHSRKMWSKPYIYYCENEAYKRKLALQQVSEEKYQKDIVSGTLCDYIIAEFSRARHELREERFSLGPEGYHTLAKAICGDLPTLYYALTVLLKSHTSSLASMALLQQSSYSLRNTITTLMHESEILAKSIAILSKLHKAGHRLGVINEGSATLTSGCGHGLSFELKNVSFNYPGSLSISMALDDVSLSIPAGSLVVIVGENGSGKSTLINLLTRMYDAKEGEILVDSLPIQSYALAELRKTTALLNQEHQIFPLSLYENIALGFPERGGDIPLVLDSIDKGGATFVHGFIDGMYTCLEPVNTAAGYNIHDMDDPVHVALHAELAKFETRCNVSGGQRQRIVAARTFMRFHSGKVRFVAVDEPSSAMDADAELRLFRNLINAREGKTMLFVTHRFGHLTKDADIILYMKDGKIAEKGTHKELLTLNGGYAKLYGIQARAFSTEVS